ncbi:voltage-dependent T-type calcium channel subunit alpha-1I-like [Oncorhynchus kisutch]|uniref:voltage-dependent T-type calcium channel subunit alpha-1I-like n=1 Tax=Oncorhynchus kisutch TaxID=8019 RepID=UPI0012DF7EC2|nr:voltage-dependent T-type calcium channel subunit alpha-1I-like [Oncorhynchus kisutch]
MTTKEEGPGAEVSVSISRDEEMPLPRRGSSLEEEEEEKERRIERRMEGSILEEQVMEEEEECNGDNNDDVSSDISTLIVPYPELAPVIFFCLKQTTFPRSCRMVEYSLDLQNINLSAIRTVRVLRPLKAINRVPSMRILVNLLLDTLPMLGNVLLLCFFRLLHLRRHRSAAVGGATEEPLLPKENFTLSKDISLPRPYYMADEDDERPFICSLAQDNGIMACTDVPARRELGRTCCLDKDDVTHRQGLGLSPEPLVNGSVSGPGLCVNWNQYYTRCHTGHSNPHKGAINFDNIAYAWIVIFQVITLEGWVEIMYYVMDAHSFYNFIYFILLIIGLGLSPEPLVNGSVSGPGLCVNWNQYYTRCHTGHSNPHKGAINFDNIAYAWIVIFQVITLEGWVEIMYYVMDAHSFYNFIYFILLIIIGSFFMINLCLVVIATQFSETKQREHQLMQEQRAQAHSSSTLASMTEPSAGCYESVFQLVCHVLRKARRRSMALCNRLLGRPKEVKGAGRRGGGEKTNVNGGGRGVGGERRGQHRQAVHCPHHTKPQHQASPGDSISLTLSPATDGCPHCTVALSISDGAGPADSLVNLEVEEGALEKTEGEGSKCDAGKEDEKDAAPARVSGGCRRGCGKLWEETRLKLLGIVESKYFNRGIMIAILINTISMGIEHHNQPEELTNVLEICNIVFTSMFAMEMILKITASGCFNYLRNPYNVFDGVIVIISVCEIIGQSDGGLSILRTFRLLRVLKLVRFMPALRRQLVVLMKTMDNVATFCMLLMLFIFIFSILGMHIFGCKFSLKTEAGDTVPDRKNFDSLLWAIVTVFQILTQEDWNTVLYNGMAATSPLAALYFVALMTFGNYVLFNLLVAILVEGFQAEGDANRSYSEDDSSPSNFDESEKLNDSLKLSDPKICTLTPNGHLELTTLTPVMTPRGSYPTDRLTYALGSRKSSVMSLGKANLEQRRSFSLHHGRSSLRHHWGRPPPPQSAWNRRSSWNSLGCPSRGVGGMGAGVVGGSLRVRSPHSHIHSLYHSAEHEFLLSPALRLPPHHAPPLPLLSRRNAIRHRDRRALSLELPNMLQVPGGPPSHPNTRMRSVSGGGSSGSGGMVVEHHDCNGKAPSPTGVMGPQTAQLLTEVFPQLNLAKDRSDLDEEIDYSLCFRIQKMMEVYRPDWCEKREDWSVYLFSPQNKWCLRVVSKGLYLGEKAYLKSSWNVLDGFLVFVSLIDIVVSMAGGAKILGVLRVLRLLRTLRPLRVISRAPGLKLVVETLITSLKPIGNIVLICCAFFIIFGILGVQLFKGKFYYCLGLEVKNITNKSDCLQANYRWVHHKYNFDNLGQALMSLFVLASKDGWVNIMYHGLDAVGIDQQPSINNNPWMLLYFISFLLIVSFFVLNMFVGVVVENFHKCRQNQEVEEAKRREEKRQRRMEKKRRKAQKLPYYTNYSHGRLMIHTLCTSHYLDLFITFIICINVITMSLEHYSQPQSLETSLKYCNYFFTTTFVVESVLKLIGFGFRRFFKDRWNQLDLSIVLLSVMGIILEEIDYNASLPINPTIIRIMRVLRIARVLKLLKMATGMRALLDTVVQALPQVGNLGLLFMLLFFIYAALGVELFGELVCNADYPCEGMSRHATFENFGMAFLTLFQVSTGDNWNGIMKDTLRECPPGPSDYPCHAGLQFISPMYFVSFVLTAPVRTHQRGGGCAHEAPGRLKQRGPGGC